jgi:chitinase
MNSVYFQSWSSKWVSSGKDLDLANLDSRINVVNIAFVNPGCNYVKGLYSFAGTGLDFSMDFGVVKDAIALLKGRGVVVMLSVGGGSYAFPPSNNAVAVCSLAVDLGVDGIDLDWEPSNGVLSSGRFGEIISEYRAVWGGKLSAAVWSTGAGRNLGSGYSGMNVDGLKSNGVMLNWINFMAYDAGSDYDVEANFGEYRNVYSGKIYLGIEVGQQGWGGYVTVQSDIDKALACVKKDGNAGIFIWSLQKDSVGSPSVDSILGSVSSILSSGVVGGVSSEKEWKLNICCPACQYNIKLDYF